MTIKEAIRKADRIRSGNSCSEDEKISWLSTLDGIIKKEIIDTHKGSEAGAFNGYDKNVDTDTVLIVPEPYSDVYISYILAQIDLHCGELNQYNNSMTLFESQYKKFANYWNRTHRSNGITNFLY